MKVYSISKWTFRGICLLILLLPVSRHWRLLTGGARTTGTVSRYVERMEDSRYPVEASEIEFLVDGRIHKAFGPANYEYEQGRTVRVLYARNDPSANFVVTFSGFYLSSYTILPLVLITVWYAFYLSFNNYHKKQGKQGKTRKFSSFKLPSVRRKN